MSKLMFLECVNLVGAPPKNYSDEKIYVSTGAVDCNSIDTSQLESVTFKNRPSRANLTVDEGDILFAKMQNTHKVLLVNKQTKEYLYSTGFFAVRPKKEFLTKECLFYLLNSPQFLIQKDKYCSGATQKAITVESLSKLMINVPKISDQGYAVNSLEIVSTLIEKRNQQLEKLDLLIKSNFNEMFVEYDLRNFKSNWAKIGDVAEVVGGSTPKTENYMFWGGPHFWITPAEINEDSFTIERTQRTLTDLGVKSCSLKLLPIGTVLLSSRAPIGKVAIAGIEMYCNQGFKNLICTKALNPIYAYYLLKFNSKFLNSLGRGATFKEISKSIVENILIPVPPIELQNNFARFVEQIEKSKLTIKQSLNQLQTLKKALMQKYFGGGNEITDYM